MIEYIKTNCNWYEGVAIGYPLTNNGLEATNNDIKADKILRKKLPLNQFLPIGLSIVQKWSIERNPAHKHAKLFHEIPSIDTKLATPMTSKLSASIKSN